MAEEITTHLNEAWNSHSDEDCVVWCELVVNDTVYLTWHTFITRFLSNKYLSDIIFILFRDYPWVNNIHTPIRNISRDVYQRFMANLERRKLQYNITY
jgi:hypothetical protein